MYPKYDASELGQMIALGKALEGNRAQGSLNDRVRPPTFFIIWCPTSKLAPQVRFDTEAQAHQVANNMAREQQQTFYVLQALEEIMPVHTATTRLT